jgi:hypothetical protein
MTFISMSSTVFRLPILAQDTVAVDTVLQYFATVVLTPLGLAGLAAGALAIALILFIRKGVPVLPALTMVLLTMMIHESTLSRNILVGPLHSLRSISRPISFALMAAAVLATLAIPRGDRSRTVPFTAFALYLFQMYYALNMVFFVDPLKGFLALFSISAMFVVCVIGFGRRMQDVDSARVAMEVFAWVGIAFCGLNLLQLAVGPGSAVVGGRFAGISGNAQQAAGVCTSLFLTNLYLFGDLSPLRPMKWVCAVLAGVLALFILWSGSRSGVLASGIGVLLMYRFSLGRAAAAAIFAGFFLFVGFLLFEGSSEGFGRIIDTGTGNTRAAVFANAVADWMSSPLIGVMPFGYENGVESSYLRALASLGILGVIAILIPFAAMAASLPKALWVGRLHPEARRLSDLYVGVIGSFVIINVFEGFAFGVLTFPMMAIYLVLAAGGFLFDRYPSSVTIGEIGDSDWNVSAT